MNHVEPIRDKRKIKAMKLYLKKHSMRNYLLFSIGISSALRISDILELKVYHVWDGKYVPEFIEVKEKKSGKMKIFPVSLNLKNAIQEYIMCYQPTSPDQYLFFSKKGINQPITRFQALRIIKEAGLAVGVKENLGSHSMRKTWGYWAYREGYPIALICEALNHSSERVTRRYIGITKNDVDEMYLTLNL